MKHLFFIIVLIAVNISNFSLAQDRGWYFSSRVNDNFPSELLSNGRLVQVGFYVIDEITQAYPGQVEGNPVPVAVYVNGDYAGVANYNLFPNFDLFLRPGRTYTVRVHPDKVYREWKRQVLAPQASSSTKIHDVHVALSKITSLPENRPSQDNRPSRNYSNETNDNILKFVWNIYNKPYYNTGLFISKGERLLLEASGIVSDGKNTYGPVRWIMVVIGGYGYLFENNALEIISKYSGELTFLKSPDVDWNNKEWTGEFTIEVIKK